MGRELFATVETVRLGSNMGELKPGLSVNVVFSLGVQSYGVVVG